MIRYSQPVNKTSKAIKDNESVEEAENKIEERESEDN